MRLSRPHHQVTRLFKSIEIIQNATRNWEFPEKEIVTRFVFKLGTGHSKNAMMRWSHSASLCLEWSLGEKCSKTELKNCLCIPETVSLFACLG